MIYDVAVIGDDLSSYVAASAASCRGLKTVLLSETGMEDIAVIGGLSFPIDATPLSGFIFSEAGETFLRDLNISSKVALLDPGYQVILPEHRIDFFHDKDLLVREFTREFPDLTQELKSFYEFFEILVSESRSWLNQHPRVKPSGIKEYFDYLHLVPSLAKIHLARMKLNNIVSRQAAFRKVIEAQQSLLSFRDSCPSSLFAFYPLMAPLLGVGWFPKGKQTIFEAAVDKVVSSGGLYLKGAETLSIKKRKPFEITYNDSDKTPSKIEAHKMIISTKWPNTHLLIDRKKKINLDDLLRPVKTTHCPFTVHLGVKPHALPEKMARHVAVICDMKRDIHDDNLIILHSCAENDQDLASGNIALTATMYLANDFRVWSQEALMLKAQSMLERLEFFLPFLKENIEFYDVNESVVISKKQRQIINSKYQLRSALLTGIAAKNNQTRLENVYLAGASLLLDIGFDGEFLSGVNAARLALGEG